MKGTQDKVKDYIANPKKSCLFCDDPDIKRYPARIDHGIATQGVMCSKCEKKWLEIYKLVDVLLI
jgi:hypothetical protein